MEQPKASRASDVDEVLPCVDKQREPQAKADEDGRSLKNYMEKVLIDDSNS